MNKFIADGNLGRDAELKFLPDKTPVVSFSLAVKSGFGKSELSNWFNCSYFGKRAESVAPFLKSGTRILVCGEVSNRPYETKEKVKAMSLDLRVEEITLLGKKDDDNNAQSQHNEQKSNGYQKQAIDEIVEDIPF